MMKRARLLQFGALLVIATIIGANVAFLFVPHERDWMSALLDRDSARTLLASPDPDERRRGVLVLSYAAAPLTEDETRSLVAFVRRGAGSDPDAYLAAARVLGWKSPSAESMIVDILTAPEPTVSDREALVPVLCIIAPEYQPVCVEGPEGLDRAAVLQVHERRSGTN